MTRIKWKPEWREVSDTDFQAEVGVSEELVVVAFLPEPWPDDFDSPGDVQYLKKRLKWLNGLEKRHPNVKFVWFLSDNSRDESQHLQIGIDVLPAYIGFRGGKECWRVEEPAIATRQQLVEEALQGE